MYGQGLNGRILFLSLSHHLLYFLRRYNSSALNALLQYESSSNKLLFRILIEDDKAICLLVSQMGTMLFI